MRSFRILTPTRSIVPGTGRIPRRPPPDPGVLADGSTFHGPYNAKTLSAQHFLVGPGSAPEATLYALRVFGCSGTTDMVVDAIDWAAKNHLDVISLSLGSVFGDPQSPDAVAADNASKAGVVVVAAAGNEGPAAYTNSTPGASSRAIEVAAVDAIPRFPGATIAVGSGLSAIVANEATGFPVTGRLDVLSGTAGAIGLGCSADDYANVQPGDIVVTLRGDCPRVDRATLGQAAGAAAVIMVNNTDKDAYPPLEGAIKDVTIPFLGVKPSGAAALQTAGGTMITISAGFTLANPAFKAVADFSSGGPAADGSLKPDVAAPGLSVFSAAVGTGTGGVRESGTSMSTPHVAGVAALVRQAHPSWTPEQVKAAIMNTASATAIAGYDPRLAGAGLVQPASAAQTVALATTGAGLASLSFGAPALDAAYASSRTIRVQNTSRGVDHVPPEGELRRLDARGAHHDRAIDRDGGRRTDGLGLGQAQPHGWSRRVPAVGGFPIGQDRRAQHDPRRHRRHSEHQGRGSLRVAGAVPVRAARPVPDHDAGDGEPDHGCDRPS